MYQGYLWQSSLFLLSLHMLWMRHNYCISRHCATACSASARPTKLDTGIFLLKKCSCSWTLCNCALRRPQLLHDDEATQLDITSACSGYTSTRPSIIDEAAMNMDTSECTVSCHVRGHNLLLRLDSRVIAV